jgi:3-methylfumaryl-CoA hydratase
MAVDIKHLRTWIGKTETTSDFASAAQLAGYSAMLDLDDPYPKVGDRLPPSTHWLHFLPQARQSLIGSDGHPERGAFLPPVELPRRMWAGSRLEFKHYLKVGEEIQRVSTIKDVTHKHGKTGDLVFCVVRHEISNADGVAIVDEHDIVYRDEPILNSPLPSPLPAPEGGEWSCLINPDPVLLFRYSALTFNGHRIHYDRTYVTETEGYPGLIVHGPLIATLLMDLARRQKTNKRMSAFSFRAVSPVFDIASFHINGRSSNDGRMAQLWASKHDGALAMKADAAFE